jgi:hypothetical protein
MDQRASLSQTELSVQSEDNVLKKLITDSAHEIDDAEQQRSDCIVNSSYLVK